MQCPKCRQHFYGLGECPECNEPLLSDIQMYKLTRKQRRQAMQSQVSFKLGTVIRSLVKLAVVLCLVNAFLMVIMKCSSLIVEHRQWVIEQRTKGGKSVRRDKFFGKNPRLKAVFDAVGLVKGAWSDAGEPEKNNFDHHFYGQDATPVSRDEFNRKTSAFGKPPSKLQDFESRL